MPPLLLPLILLPLLAIAATASDPSSLHLPLLRHPPNPTRTRLDRLRAIAHLDRRRQRQVATSIGRRQKACVSPGPPPQPPPPAEFQMPMSSGAYTGTGQYFVRIRVGTPAQPVVLVADTGSDLTWVNCRYRRRRRGRGGRRRREGGRAVGRAKRVFLADRSRTFDPISCSSDPCKTTLPFSLTTCPTPASPCAYDYQYADGSEARGFFANESATVTRSDGRKSKLKGLVVGCTSASSGAGFRSADGVLGLGYSSISFAAREAARFGGRFSYCLVDHLSPKNASGYLAFGFNGALSRGAASQAELVIDRRLEPFYAAGVEGISVGGEVLPIPPSVWDLDKGGGAILDSGTSLTVLAEPAYRLVTAALSRRLSRVPRADVDPFEYCYNWTAVAKGEEEIVMPKLVVHFNGSARLEPPVKSYVIDVADGVKCLGFTPASFPGVSTLGNIIQQEHIWEFDIRNRRLRFQPSKCVPNRGK